MAEEIVPPTGLVMRPVKITHNNDRKHYVIAIDDAKEGTAIWNLDPYFKARVSDSNATLEVVWYHQGRLQNFNAIEEAKPFISGNVGGYSIDDQQQIKLDPGSDPVDFTGSTEDVGDGGRVDYHFPDAMFPKSGIFKGFIGIQDKQGRVSGVTIWFRVLDGIARMGTAKQVYFSEMEEMKLQHEQDWRLWFAKAQQEQQENFTKFTADQQTKLSEFEKATTDIEKQMNDTFTQTLTDHTKNFDTEMATINEKLDLANQLAKGIANAYNTEAEAVDANSEAIRNGLAPMLNKSNVFVSPNTFSQTVIANGGATFSGTVLVNGTDLKDLIDKVNKLEISVNKLQGGAK